MKLTKGKINKLLFKNSKTQTKKHYKKQSIINNYYSYKNRHFLNLKNKSLKK